MSDAHIMNIAFRTGGQAVLSAAGEEDNGTELLRDAIATFAQDGGAAYVSDTIESLFPNSDSLSDEQLGQLGSALVENYQP
jgi:hypothetical protein